MATSQGNAGGGLGGGGLEVEQIRAFRDVHSLAPDRKMEARRDLDLQFVEAEPTPVVAAAGSATTEAAADAPAPEAARAIEPAQAQDQVAAQDPASKAPAEPSNKGVADHIWAVVARKSGSGLDPTSSRRRARTAAKPNGASGNVASTETAGTVGAPTSGTADSDSELREAWLRGNVAMHQDSPPDKPENPDGTKAKPKSQDITGEAVYLDNHKGKGKMLAWVFYRDPNQPPRPGPLPWARVSNDDMTIRGEKIRLDQEHDKVWGDGPGVLTQWTDRAMLSGKSEGPAGDSGSGTGAAAPAGSSTSQGNRIRTASNNASGTDPATGTAPATKPKPKMRAGRPVAEKELFTITWKQRMEFTGRTVDPTGRHTGRADFFGSPNAKTEDVQIKCVDRMIVFTDREVPLGELGSLSKGTGKTDSAEAGAASEDIPTKDRSQVDLSLIYCYGETVAVSRKIDPELPIYLEKQEIFAERELHYNRLTGDFLVPGPGRVYKWDRSDDSNQTKDGAARAETETVQNGNREDGQPQRNGRANVPRRAVTPTSGRAVAGGPNSAGSGRRATAPSQRGTGAAASRNVSRGAQPATPTNSRKIPPLILTQIFFERQMKGSFLTGPENDQSHERSALFFGDIQFRRAEVNSVDEAFDFDQTLPEDGFYMTSQILRLIQEPPPAGSPELTPARTLAKAWDDVIVNKGESAVLQSDMATYDSETDKLYAYSEGDRKVALAQQVGVGQPFSQTYGQAVQFNVKTGGFHFINSDVVQLFDKRTGARPGKVPPPDPNAPKKKRKNPVFQVPNQNLERRGFTGQ